MSYESPIKLFTTDPVIEKIKDETDALILRAVAQAHVEVDREELIKALEYDRAQYLKGYADGVEAGRGKRGQWELTTLDDGYGEYQLYKCDKCGGLTAQRRNFCPDCGAEMREEQT